MSEPYWVPLSGVPAVGPVPSCRVYNNADQSIATSTLQALTFNSERWDTDNIHDVATNPTRLTCRTAGKYLISGSVAWETTAGSGAARIVAVRDMNAVTVARDRRAPQTDLEQHIQTVIDMAVGDWVELCVFQDQGSSKPLKSIGNYSPEFEAIRIDTLFGALAPVGGSAAPLVTTLPASPVDGQECILCDSLSAPTYTWHLKYVAAKASNKWVFVGGAPLRAEVTTLETTASTTYVALATAGPALVIPVAGIYDIGVGFVSQTAKSSFMSYDIGATGAVDADAVTNGIAGTADSGGAWTRFATKTLAAVTLTAKYKATTPNTCGWQYRWMQATPRAIGG